jgi:citrate lyase gamma subunit
MDKFERRETSMDEDGHDDVEKSLGKILRQIDDCLNKLSNRDQVDFLASLRVQAKGRLDEIEKAQLEMAIAEWAGRANHDQ